MYDICYSNQNIVIEKNGFKILLDPHKNIDGDLAFVSHAHIDHMSKSLSRIMKVLTTSETSTIAKARGYKISKPVAKSNEFELIDSGHILGSRGLLVNNSIFYTGDISIRKRGFLNPDPLPSVETLIIESTFAKPCYVFPDVDQIIHNVNMLISDLYNHGIPVILMGYALGKAQLLTTYFDHWDPLYIHDTVNIINRIYSSFGIPLKESITFSQADKEGLLNNKPWVMVAPMMNCRNKFVRYMKTKYGAVTIGFSGWAINKGYASQMGLDYAFPLSDHCDYHELLRVVDRCNPSKIFTFHGFADGFAKDLRKRGYDAQPIYNTDRHSLKIKKSNTLDMYF